MIELKHISKWHMQAGKPVFILKDINLTVKEGEFISIMGPSGSGKSTLLNVIGMLDESNEGEYFFLGEPVHKLKEKQRSKLYKQYIGFVFQAYHLIDELTVYENIETPLLYQDVKSSERKAMVADILDRFQIVGKKDLFPSQLSGGQQQLVGIARALIVKPKLILADEPTGNLNSKQGEEIMELFTELNNEGVTIIQVTHSEKKCRIRKQNCEPARRQDRNATYKYLMNLLRTKTMKERIVACLLSLCTLIGFKGVAQTNEQRLTLKQAVDAAINNNLLVRQTDLQMQAAQVNTKQAKANVLPDLFFNANQGINEGRSIDPFTNSYINQRIGFGNYSLSSNVTLFNGFQLMNLIKQNALTYEANKMDLQQQKDNVTLNVILAYLQILNNDELVQQSKNQADVTRQQVERLNVMNESGAIAPALLYDLKGQLANDELAIINNRNALNSAKLTLAQLMNVPYQANLALEKITGDSITLNYANTPDALYNLSVNQLAIVKAAEFRRQSAQKSVQVAKGMYYPTLGLGGSFNTYYSSAATTSVQTGTEEVISNDYIKLSGSKVPVMTTRTNYSIQKISYGNQFNDNYNTSVYLSLQIPILNRFRAKNRVALAKIDLRNAEITAQAVKTQLSQNIEQAYFNMTAAQDRYKTLQQQVADFSESFRSAEVRFNAGVINQVDYLIAKNNVDRARTNFITAKYDYIFRTKILDYYQNKLRLD